MMDPPGWSFALLPTDTQIPASAITPTVYRPSLHKLPPEVRMMIFRLCLYDDDGLIFCYHDSKQKGPISFRIRDYLPARFRSLADGPVYRLVEKDLITKADVSILRTCRLFRSEAYESLLKVNKIVFFGLPIPEEFNYRYYDFETYVEMARADVIKESKRLEFRYFDRLLGSISERSWFFAQAHAIKSQMRTSLKRRATLTIALSKNDHGIAPAARNALDHFRFAGLFSPMVGVEVTRMALPLSSSTLGLRECHEKQLLIQKVAQIEDERSTRLSFMEKTQAESPFLSRLPAEIRKSIYGYVFSSPQGLKFRAYNYRQGPWDMDRHRNAIGSFETDMDPSLLHTCKLIRNEAQYIALENNTLIFSTASDLLPTSTLAKYLSNLRDYRASLARLSTFELRFTSGTLWSHKIDGARPCGAWFAQELHDLAQIMKLYPPITVTVALEVDSSVFILPQHYALIGKLKIARDRGCFSPRVRPKLVIYPKLLPPLRDDSIYYVTADKVRCLNTLRRMVADIQEDFCCMKRRRES